MQSQLAILDSLREGCQVIDHDWRYLYVNEAVARHGRTTREALLGRTMMEAYPGIEATELFGALQQCMEEQTATEIENEFVYPDGTRGWFELRVEPVPEGLFILSLDINSRKRAELELDRQLQQLDSLRAIDLAILGTTDVRLALKTVAQETRDRLGVDDVTIFLLDSATMVLESAARLGAVKRASNRELLRLGVGVTGRAGLEQRTLIVADTGRNGSASTVRAEITEETAGAVCAVPLIAKGKLIGVMRLLNRSRIDAEPRWLEFLEALAGQASMAVDIGLSFQALQRANFDLNLAYDRTIEGWSRALDIRDNDTGEHTRRVTELTVRLAREAGMTDTELTHVRRGALLHDIGKMGVPDHILGKPGPLTPEEWAVMRRHPQLAYDMLHHIDHLRPALDIPYCHHEKWDGTGYPRGLSGHSIPLAARLFAVVDVADALRSDRPYRPAWPEPQVQEYIRQQAGSHFDPYAVELLLRANRA